jgi:Concanavalin A-like lectin/glucanases superfamily/PKD domain
VRFDSSTSYDPDGTIATRHWSFGDGTEQSGAGVTATHTYTAGGRYFPKLTVTDNRGARHVFVDEIVVDAPAPPTVHSGGASGNTVHGAIDPENQAAEWSVEYGPTEEYGAVVQGGQLPGDASLHQVATALPGLEQGRLYHYRLVAVNASGTSEGEDRVMVAGRTPGRDAYGDAVLGTTGLAAYWRLGELSGSTARDERTGATGAFAGRFLLGGVGVLGPLGNTAAGFDGQSGELSAPGPALQTNATLEGWFRWRAGTSTLRDHTGTGGWLLAFSTTGNLTYRLGGKGFDTGVPVGQVRDGEWHHIAATKQGASAALYVDGELVHAGTGAGSAAAIGPWHVMRNGTNAVFSEGEADEIALYTRALSAAEVRSHYDLAASVAGGAGSPGTTATRSPVAEPPAAGTGRGGGVLGGGG